MAKRAEGFKVNSGEKYAAIAIPECWLAPTLPEVLHVATDLWIARKLPFDIPDHWKQWIGTLRLNQLEGAKIFLLSKAPSADPGVLDHENERLRDRVWRFYWGLMLSGFLRPGGEPFRFTGSNDAGDISIRSMGNIPPVTWMYGSPMERIGVTRIREAARLAHAIGHLAAVGGFARIWRVTHAFFDGMHAQRLPPKLHQFVRCVEGFILPERGSSTKRFKSRTELFVGPKHHRLTGELYELRSAIEHLHDPAGLAPGTTERDKALYLVKRTVEAEALARYCVRHLLLKRRLWQHFRQDSNLSDFWNLADADRQNLWGKPLDMVRVSGSFDPRYIPEHALQI